MGGLNAQVEYVLYFVIFGGGGGWERKVDAADVHLEWGSDAYFFFFQKDRNPSGRFGNVGQGGNTFLTSRVKANVLGVSE